MRPETIQKREDEFFGDLTNSAGVKYKLTATTDIGKGVKIYSIRPEFDSYYYKTKTTKKSICLHFTVGYIKSDTASLSTKDNCVSVSYVVDRSGRIYEMFPDTEWSYHLGKGAVGGNGTMSKQSIGIEISNYGPLKLSGDKLVDVYGNEYCKESETEFYSKQNFRGYDYYASMTDVQIDSVSALVRYLGRKHDIPMDFRPDDSPFASNSEATSFRGVFYHTNVRKDKFDWPFTPSLKAIVAKCSDTLPPEPVVAPDAVKTATAAPKPVEAKTATAAPKVQEVAPTASEMAAEVLPRTTVSSVDSTRIQKPAPKKAPAKKTTSLFDLVISLLLQFLGGKKK